MSRYLWHLGGNGHAQCRLEPVRAALLARQSDLHLIDLEYPGFEGRPRARSLDDFLDQLSRQISRQTHPTVAAYASGIGALIALGLRARGDLHGVRLIFQGPVLWGLENRWFPFLMRSKPAQVLLQNVFQTERFQKRFVRKQFRRAIDPEWSRQFFNGYRDCAAFGDFFRWFSSAWLRTLESTFADRPDRLHNIEVWIGQEDHVVGLDELIATEQALKVAWPCKVMQGWGHYPMIDIPEEWADALEHALANPGAV